MSVHYCDVYPCPVCMPALTRQASPFYTYPVPPQNEQQQRMDEYLTGIQDRAKEQLEPQVDLEVLYHALGLVLGTMEQGDIDQARVLLEEARDSVYRGLR